MQRFPVFSALALLLIAGCGRHSKSEHYYLLATNIGLPYWQAANAGLQRAAEEAGVSTEMRGAMSFDPAVELREFKDMLARKPAGILISVADPRLLTPEINAAIDAGVPVITVDADAPDSRRLYFIGTNNLEAGRLGGQRVAANLDGKGNVVFFTNPKQENLDERLKGYKDVFAAYPGIHVAEVFDIHGDSGNALDKAGEYLRRTGPAKIDAVVCLEASSGKDVAEAFKRAGAQGRTLVAMDTDRDVLFGVGNGVIDATVAQKPYTMAYLGLKALVAMHEKPIPFNKDYAGDPSSPLPAFVDTGVALVDKQNVDSFLAKPSAESGQ